jgi:superfamily II DNA or RNA helicase
LNERHDFFCIRGSDFDRLETDDFRAIEAWLADTLFNAPKKQPQPHQTEALNALLPALRQHDRVSAIMACGTGKTLIALWVAEKLRAQRILVLLPSLALLRQTLHEWLRETSLPGFAYLCVCSDPTVREGLDAVATPQSDLDFQVSTDPASVREFLDAPFTGVRVIFSTYQSTQVVRAALKPDEVFDFAVFDEAHKTAGREGRNYSIALDDRSLPIRKRLFLTATPRHYNPLSKDKRGDAQLVFSMEKPEVYGPQAYRLTFGDAARRGIICRYKVIISVITSRMVTNELLNLGETLVNGDVVRARQVANQLALKDAIAHCGAHKVFTFHSRVDAAASFTAKGNEGVSTHLPEFESFHVNGEMPTALREGVMRDFRASARAIMSNARCLTEGVDVPAVDMVAFMSPRRSKIDIVQATGRAMRVAPGKTTGFVLVPLYVEQAGGETVEQAIARAEFDEVWQVLQSLQEQDDVLAETISRLREDRGRGKGFAAAGFQDQVDILGPKLRLEVLRSAITTKCADALGSTWDERFGQLKAYREQTGHCLVSVADFSWRQLRDWVALQRQLKRVGKLSDERVRKLKEIGFVWGKGHATCPTGVGEKLYMTRPPAHAFPLSLKEARAIAAHGRRMGWLQEPKRSSKSSNPMWEDSCAKLAEFHNLHGHCDVKLVVPLDEQLHKWAQEQRKARGLGVLTADQARQLDQLGFIWDTSGLLWERMFRVLVVYKSVHGDCNVPRYWQENLQLAIWVASQRKRQRIGQLNAEQVLKLEQIGFGWDAA